MFRGLDHWFLRLTVIRNDIDHTKVERMQHAKLIDAYGPAVEEMTKIGAASVIELSDSLLIYVTQTVEEITELLNGITEEG